MNLNILQSLSLLSDTFTNSPPLAIVTITTNAIGISNNQYSAVPPLPSSIPIPAPINSTSIHGYYPFPSIVTPTTTTTSAISNSISTISKPATIISDPTATTKITTAASSSPLGNPNNLLCALAYSSGTSTTPTPSLMMRSTTGASTAVIPFMLNPIPATTAMMTATTTVCGGRISGSGSRYVPNNGFSSLPTMYMNMDTGINPVMPSAQSGYRTVEIVAPNRNKIRALGPNRKVSNHLCRDFATGFCSYGTNCKFYHESDKILEVEHLWCRQIPGNNGKDYDYIGIFHSDGKKQMRELSLIILDYYTRKQMSRYHQFIKPYQISDGKKDQEKVNTKSTAVTLQDALNGIRFELARLGVVAQNEPTQVRRSKTIIFATCGNWDIKTQIPKQCRRNRLETPEYFKEWANVKDICLNFYSNAEASNCYGMQTLLQFLNIKGCDNYYFSMDKADDIAKIVLRLLEDGAKLSPTAVRLNEKKVKYLNKKRIRPFQHQFQMLCPTKKLLQKHK